MNKRNIKIWTDALRSGEYRQGKYALQQGDENPRFCCLGVAADVLVDGDWIKRGSMWLMDERACALSGKILNQIGLSSEAMWELTKFNDSGKNFNWIANWIEENAHRLHGE